jgi:hypothetical protein
MWQHSEHQWGFIDEESHKDETRSVAKYKQHALNEKIRATYRDKNNLTHPLKPLQERDDLLLRSYNIRKAWLRSSELYILLAQAHNALSKGT